MQTESNEKQVRDNKILLKRTFAGQTNEKKVRDVEGKKRRLLRFS